MEILSRRPELPSDKRRAIEADVLHATEALLGEGASYANLSIERIATRAGISRTAFYFYFADKRELLMRLAADVGQQLYDEAATWWSGSGDGSAQLTEALGKIAALYRAHGPLVCAIVEVSTYDPPVGVFWRELVGRFVDASAARIAAEQAAGRAATALDPTATAFALVWMTERSFHQMVVQEEPVAAEQLVAALAAIWRATVYGAPVAPQP
jgi:AcrR family transcriptional regulator